MKMIGGGDQISVIVGAKVYAEVAQARGDGGDVGEGGGAHAGEGEGGEGGKRAEAGE